MASQGGRDKSWAEIAGEAFQLAKQAGGKVVEGIHDLGSRFLPQGEQPRSTQEEIRRREAYSSRPRRPQDPYGGSPLAELGRSGGLFGRAAGGLLGGMMDQVMSQVAQSSAQSEEMLQQSLSRIQSDDRVSSALGGGVQIVPGMRSQSLSTVYINGRKMQDTTVGFNVVGRSGRPAAAQASMKDGEVDVTVQLPDGRGVIRVGKGGGGSGFGGREKKPTEVIDVEWREVR